MVLNLPPFVLYFLLSLSLWYKSVIHKAADWYSSYWETEKRTGWSGNVLENLKLNTSFVCICTFWLSNTINLYFFIYLQDYVLCCLQMIYIITILKLSSTFPLHQKITKIQMSHSKIKSFNERIIIIWYSEISIIILRRGVSSRRAYAPMNQIRGRTSF